ncbi:hypothetical protein HPY86_04290 [candidate division WOR-3 bacterium]|nr:hypothetical protein [candidate division WOR-3 bacterium]
MHYIKLMAWVVSRKNGFGAVKRVRGLVLWSLWCSRVVVRCNVELGRLGRWKLPPEGGRGSFPRRFRLVINRLSMV